MKKVSLALVILGFISSASAVTYVGGSVGSELSAHYQDGAASSSATRYSLNLSGFSSSTLGVGVDFLKPAPSSLVKSLGSLNPYWGYGLDADISLSSTSAVGLYPHVLGGLNYDLSEDLNIFGELGIGPVVSFGSTSWFSIGTDVRLGINYKLR